MQCEVEWLMITTSHTWGGMNNNCGTRKNNHYMRKMPDDFAEHAREPLKKLISRYKSHAHTVKRWLSELKE